MGVENLLQAPLAEWRAVNGAESIRSSREFLAASSSHHHRSALLPRPFLHDPSLLSLSLSLSCARPRSILLIALTTLAAWHDSAGLQGTSDTTKEEQAEHIVEGDLSTIHCKVQSKNYTLIVSERKDSHQLFV